LFIEQSYSSGFQYQLSTDHHMSGSPLIIYPSGEIIGPQHIKPFIIGVHTEGHNNCEEDLKRKNPCHEEKYNYGKKIMKDFLSSEQNDYKEITCT
jgi:V8-like Glu-specific endopeptidase